MARLHSILNRAGKLLIVSLFLTGTAVSCYDDSALWEKIDGIETDIESLQTEVAKLNDQFQALDGMIKGQITISSCVKAQDGSYTVELTSGEKFTIYPKQEKLQSVVTYITIRGEKFWAVYDENGKKELILDANNERIPVVSVVPKVIDRDGKAFLVVGTAEYPLTGNSVFSGYELHTNPMTGEVTSVTFTFGDEGLKFTVDVDRENPAFRFVMQSGMDFVDIHDYFVPFGCKDRILYQATGVKGFIIQAPEGWKAAENDESPEFTYLDVQAPKATAVKDGSAAAEGTLKVYCALEGKGSDYAELHLTSSPFADFRVSEGNVVINKNTGLQKFVYGFCKKADFNETTMFDTASTLLESYDYPLGYGVADYDVNQPVKEIFGSDVIVGESYVLWAVPAVYDYENEEVGYYLSRDSFVTLDIRYTDVQFTVSDVNFRDAKVNLSLKGIDSYYAGTEKKTEATLEDILWGLNNGQFEAQTLADYSGSAFHFAGTSTKPESATSYVSWLAVARPDGVYTEGDVIVREFTTNDITSGGSVTLAASAVNIEPSYVTLQLTPSAENSVIAYTFLKTSSSSRYPDDASRVKYILGTGTVSDSLTVHPDSRKFISLKPEQDVTLFAVAVGADGKYGPVLVKDYTTDALVYNNLTATAEVLENTPGNIRVKFTTTGGDAASYVYWVGLATDTFFKGSNYLGGTQAKAEEFISLNPTNNTLRSAMAKYPVQDGIITVKDLPLKKDAVVVLMAKDASGVLSHATILKFQTRSIDLGEIVKAKNADGTPNPVWEAAAPTIEWLPHLFVPASGMRFAEFGFNLTFTTDLHAYVLCGTDYYFSPDGAANVPTEDKMLYIIEEASKAKDIDVLIDEKLWVEQGYPNGWEFHHYVHGALSHGKGAIFSETMEEHRQHCKCIDSYTGDSIIELNMNTGQPHEVRMPSGTGSGDVDKVFIVFKDKAGNYYEPYRIDVPDEMFK